MTSNHIGRGNARVLNTKGGERNYNRIFDFSDQGTSFAVLFQANDAIHRAGSRRFLANLEESHSKRTSASNLEYMGTRNFIRIIRHVIAVVSEANACPVEMQSRVKSMRISGDFCRTACTSVRFRRPIFSLLRRKTPTAPSTERVYTRQPRLFPRKKIARFNETFSFSL